MKSFKDEKNHILKFIKIKLYNLLWWLSCKIETWIFELGSSKQELEDMKISIPFDMEVK